GVEGFSLPSRIDDGSAKSHGIRHDAELLNDNESFLQEIRPGPLVVWVRQACSGRARSYDYRGPDGSRQKLNQLPDTYPGGPACVRNEPGGFESGSIWRVA